MQQHAGWPHPSALVTLGMPWVTGQLSSVARPNPGTPGTGAGAAPTAHGLGALVPACTQPGPSHRGAAAP